MFRKATPPQTKALIQHLSLLDLKESTSVRGTKRSAGDAELEEGGEEKRGKVEEGDDDVIVLG